MVAVCSEGRCAEIFSEAGVACGEVVGCMGGICDGFGRCLSASACAGGQYCFEGACEALPEDFVRVPPGTFTMGSPEGEPGRDDDLEFQQEVTITRELLFQSVEVDQYRWEGMLSDRPFGDANDQCSRCPADSVTWVAALYYANGLSMAEGLDPCYLLSDCSGDFVSGSIFGCDTVEITSATGHPSDCEGYRLPSEAEWEWGARGRTVTAFHSGSLEEAQDCPTASLALDRAGWYCANADDGHHEQGRRFAPNLFGLYDMHGNVREWTYDTFASDAARGPDDPVFMDEVVEFHTVRGGSYGDPAHKCRSASRHKAWYTSSEPDIGFRLVRTVLRR